MLIGLVFFNIVDAISTYYFVVIHNAQELNPVMNYLLELNPIFFIAFKLIWVTIAFFLFWKFLPYSVVARIATVFCFVPYCLLGIYYLVGWGYLAYYGAL